MNTNQIRPLIVAHLRENLDHVAAQFVLEPGNSPATKEELLQMTSNPKDWKRRDKGRGSNHKIFYDTVNHEFVRIELDKDKPRNWIRGFDCTPFDDQLRAYVTTDPNDETVLSIEIVGE